MAMMCLCVSNSIIAIKLIKWNWMCECVHVMAQPTFIHTQWKFSLFFLDTLKLCWFHETYQNDHFSLRIQTIDIYFTFTCTYTILYASIECITKAFHMVRMIFYRFNRIYRSLFSLKIYTKPTDTNNNNVSDFFSHSME